jgi:hypothetical protein
MTKRDWIGALGLCLLSFLATFPVVIPFIFLSDAKLALRASYAIAIVMLFCCGYVFGYQSGLLCCGYVFGSPMRAPQKTRRAARTGPSELVSGLRARNIRLRRISNSVWQHIEHWNV